MNLIVSVAIILLKTVTMNLIVSVAIILLNLYVAYGHKFVYDEVSKAFTFTAQ